MTRAPVSTVAFRSRRQGNETPLGKHQKRGKEGTTMLQVDDCRRPDRLGGLLQLEVIEHLHNSRPIAPNTVGRCGR